MADAVFTEVLEVSVDVEAFKTGLAHLETAYEAFVERLNQKGFGAGNVLAVGAFAGLEEQVGHLAQHVTALDAEITNAFTDIDTNFKKVQSSIGTTGQAAVDAKAKIAKQSAGLADIKTPVVGVSGDLLGNVLGGAGSFFSGISRSVATLNGGLLGMLGYMGAIRVAWTAVGTVIQAVTNLIKAPFEIVKAGFEYLSQLQDQTASLQGPIAANVKFSEDLAANFRMAGEAAGQVAQELQSMAISMGIPVEQLQSTFRDVLESGGMHFVQSLQGAVDLTKELNIAVMATSTSTEGQRKSMNEIPKLLEGQISGMSRILTTLHLTNDEWMKIREQGLLHQDLEMRLADILKPYLTVIEQADFRWNALTRKIELQGQMIAGAIALPLWNAFIGILQTVKGYFENNGESLAASGRSIAGLLVDFGSLVKYVWEWVGGSQILKEVFGDINGVLQVAIFALRSIIDLTIGVAKDVTAILQTAFDPRNWVKPDAWKSLWDKIGKDGAETLGKIQTAAVDANQAINGKGPVTFGSKSLLASGTAGSPLVDPNEAKEAQRQFRETQEAFRDELSRTQDAYKQQVNDINFFERSGRITAEEATKSRIANAAAEANAIDVVIAKYREQAEAQRQTLSNAGTPVTSQGFKALLDDLEEARNRYALVNEEASKLPVVDASTERAKHIKQEATDIESVRAKYQSLNQGLAEVAHPDSERTKSLIQEATELEVVRAKYTTLRASLIGVNDREALTSRIRYAQQEAKELDSIKDKYKSLSTTAPGHDVLIDSFVQRITNAKNEAKEIEAVQSKYTQLESSKNSISTAPVNTGADRTTHLKAEATEIEAVRSKYQTLNQSLLQSTTSPSSDRTKTLVQEATEVESVRSRYAALRSSLAGVNTSEAVESRVRYAQQESKELDAIKVKYTELSGSITNQNVIVESFVQRIINAKNEAKELEAVKNRYADLEKAGKTLAGTPFVSSAEQRIKNAQAEAKAIHDQTTEYLKRAQQEKLPTQEASSFLTDLERVQSAYDKIYTNQNLTADARAKSAEAESEEVSKLIAQYAALDKQRNAPPDLQKFIDNLDQTGRKAARTGLEEGREAAYQAGAHKFSEVQKAFRREIQQTQDKYKEADEEINLAEKTHSISLDQAVLQRTEAIDRELGRINALIVKYSDLAKASGGNPRDVTEFVNDLQQLGQHTQSQASLQTRDLTATAKIDEDHTAQEHLDRLRQMEINHARAMLEIYQQEAQAGLHTKVEAFDKQRALAEQEHAAVLSNLREELSLTGEDAREQSKIKDQIVAEDRRYSDQLVTDVRTRSAMALEEARQLEQDQLREQRIRLQTNQLVARLAARTEQTASQRAKANIEIAQFELRAAQVEVLRTQHLLAYAQALGIAGTALEKYKLQNAEAEKNQAQAQLDDRTAKLSKPSAQVTQDIFGKGVANLGEAFHGFDRSVESIANAFKFFGSAVDNFKNAWNRGKESGGTAGAIGGVLSQAGEVLKDVPIVGPILSVAGSIFSTVGAIFTGAARKIARDVQQATDALMQQYTNGQATLTDTIAGLEAQRQAAISRLSDKKGGQDELNKILPGIDNQIAQLLNQQKTIITTFNNTVAVLRLHSDELGNVLTSWQQINKQVQDYLNAGGDATTAAEFLKLNLQKVAETTTSELGQAESQAIEDALSLNDLLTQRVSLMKSIVDQEWALRNADALERMGNPSIDNALKYQQKLAEDKKSIANIDSQISLMTTRVSLEKQVFDLASSTAGLQAQSNALNIQQLQIQIKAWQDLQQVIKNIYSGTYSYTPINPADTLPLQPGQLSGIAADISGSGSNEGYFKSIGKAANEAAGAFNQGLLSVADTLARITQLKDMIAPGSPGSAQLLAQLMNEIRELNPVSAAGLQTIDTSQFLPPTITFDPKNPSGLTNLTKTINIGTLQVTSNGVDARSIASDIFAELQLQGAMGADTSYA